MIFFILCRCHRQPALGSSGSHPLYSITENYASIIIYLSLPLPGKVLQFLASCNWLSWNHWNIQANFQTQFLDYKIWRTTNLLGRPQWLTFFKVLGVKSPKSRSQAENPERFFPFSVVSGRTLSPWSSVLHCVAPASTSAPLWLPLHILLSLLLLCD